MYRFVLKTIPVSCDTAGEAVELLKEIIDKTSVVTENAALRAPAGTASASAQVTRARLANPKMVAEIVKRASEKRSNVTAQERSLALLQHLIAANGAPIMSSDLARRVGSSPKGISPVFKPLNAASERLGHKLSDFIFRRKTATGSFWQATPGANKLLEEMVAAVRFGR